MYVYKDLGFKIELQLTQRAWMTFKTGNQANCLSQGKQSNRLYFQHDNIHAGNVTAGSISANDLLITDMILTERLTFRVLLGLLEVIWSSIEGHLEGLLVSASKKYN